MQLSKFGQKFTARSGILQLMDDLGEALASGSEDTIMLGGGNPSYIPQVQRYFHQQMANILEDEATFKRMIGNYAAPQGEIAFIEALAKLFRREYGWDIGPKNIALANGSQSAFFMLFNMFAGDFADGSHKKILLPLAPEYIGYADAGLTNDFFVARKPDFEYIDAHTFKYHINFDAISVGDDIGAICVSRPTNPTGNVLTEDEIEKLTALAESHNIPLMIDNAYGTPFPSIIFNDVAPVWNKNTILSMSLSKLGLPAARTGIVVANEEIIRAIASINAVTNLTPGSMGAILALDLFESGEIIQMSQEVVKPYYQQKAENAAAYIKKQLGDVDFYVHKPEGAIFLWLWFKGMSITSQTLYERLKARDVIIVPGHYFFPGLQEEWQHKYECIRVSYAQDEATVKRGLDIIAEEVRRAYREG